MPLVEPTREPATHARSVLEHSLVKPIAEGMLEPGQLDKVLTYGEVCAHLRRLAHPSNSLAPSRVFRVEATCTFILQAMLSPNAFRSQVIELRFTNCGMMLAVELDYQGLAFASQPRLPARREHDLVFHAPGKPKGGAGLPVCYGDVLVLKCRGKSCGQWHRLGVTPTRDLGSEARAMCVKGETHVTCVQWGEKGTTDRQLFRIEVSGSCNATWQRFHVPASHSAFLVVFMRSQGFCDLRGVALRAGDKFFLRALGCMRDGASHGCHLQAEWEQGITDGWRHVSCKEFRRGTLQEIEAFKVGPMRKWVNLPRELANLQ